MLSYDFCIFPLLIPWQKAFFELIVSHFPVVAAEQVVVFWSCLLILGAVRFLQYTSLLSSWKGIVFTATSFGLVTFLMHICILSSQSESSTRAKEAVAKLKKQGGPSEEAPKKQH